MSKRTYEKNGVLIETAVDLEDIVKDKRVFGDLTNLKLREDREDTKNA